MENKTDFTTTIKGYKVSLALSGLILVILFGIVIYQILNLQQSGNLVANHLDETRNINQLVINLNKSEEQFIESKLTNTYLDSIIIDNNKLIKDLDVNYRSYNKFLSTHNRLYNLLRYYLTSPHDVSKAELKMLFSKGRTFKNNLLNEHKTKLLSISQNFKSQNKTIPKFFLFATVITFIVLSISVYHLLRSRKSSNEKSKILDAILNNTNDIANFYKPVYSVTNEVEDFTITYASKANLTLTDVPFKNILNNKVSEVYPFLKPSGLFNQLVSAYVKQEYFEKVLEIPIKEQIRYFKARYIPVKSGLQVMITELTNLYSKQNELEEANYELSLINEVFKESEKIAKLGSYIWTINENHFAFSDNVYKILNQSKSEIDLTYKGLRDFVHNEDLEIYVDQINKILNNQESIEFNFRIVTPDGDTKYIYTSADYDDRDGEPIIIGVIQDITQRASNENRVREKNIELERRNMELDSFNRVASHDLQEPLRKIQMFISRIKELDFDNKNEKYQLYFSKIEDGATRMRSLINNLLAFSRVDSKDYQFEFTNLNTVFEEVLETFSETIKHLKVNIEVDKLPNVYGIPFLLEQLLTNLISNSLKYMARDRDTKIIIQSSKIHYKQIPQEFIKTHAYYHVIKVIDNGIGFNQTENEKVFELFQRLHERNEYSGTGIGLAICKKIVLKHHGFISANSIVNKGSIFTIYLPSGKLKMLPKKG
ncbi:hypothetical protein GCM10022291_07690 [Postechiella marina]|uniref:histidine kinase n=1 Tax=Postechiella marina TaxID=943941 RepID=A0ABP8C2N8_9FLAO